MFRSSNSSHGWNAVFGQMYGAYYPKQCPGGSSGGSAVASDLGLAWATLGSEVRQCEHQPFSFFVAIRLLPACVHLGTDSSIHRPDRRQYRNTQREEQYCGRQANCGTDVKIPSRPG